MTVLPDRFSVSPEPATAGDDIQICFDNPALAGQTITVQLDNGGGATSSIQITLDGEGHGCAMWAVPGTGWDLIKMNQATSAEHVTVVQ